MYLQISAQECIEQPLSRAKTKYMRFFALGHFMSLGGIYQHLPLTTHVLFSK